MARQDEDIRELEEKLATYNTDMAIKDELNKQFIELVEWVQEAENNLKQTDAEQSNIINGLFEKLKKSELAETVLRADNHRLTVDNKSLADQCKTLQQNENRHRTEAETMETTKKILENELHDAKNRSRELSDRLTGELVDVRGKLDGCRAVIERLKCSYGELEADLERSRAAESRLRLRCLELDVKLEDVELSATRAQAELDEAKRLAALELEEAKRLAALELDEAKRLAALELDEAKRLAALELDEAKRLGAIELAEAHATAERLRTAHERDRKTWEELKATTQRHHEDATAKLEASVASLNAQVRDHLALLEQRQEEARRLAEALDRAADDDEARGRLQRERDALADERDALKNERDALLDEVRQKAVALAELERRVSVLDRGEPERAAGDRRSGAGSSSPATPGNETICATASPFNCVATGEDEELVNELKNLYHELAVLQNKSKKRRSGDDSSN